LFGVHLSMKYTVSELSPAREGGLHPPPHESPYCPGGSAPPTRHRWRVRGGGVALRWAEGVPSELPALQPAVRGPGYLAGRVFIRGPEPAVRGSEPPQRRQRRRGRGIEPAVRTPRRRAGRAVRPSQKGCSRRVSVPQPRPCYDRPICVARARSDRPICSPQLPPALTGGPEQWVTQQNRHYSGP